LNNELRRATDKAREEWWEEQCQELENMDKKGRSIIQPYVEQSKKID